MGLKEQRERKNKSKVTQELVEKKRKKEREKKGKESPAQMKKKGIRAWLKNGRNWVR